MATITTHGPIAGMPRVGIPADADRAARQEVPATSGAELMPPALAVLASGQSPAEGRMDAAGPRPEGADEAALDAAVERLNVEVVSLQRSLRFSVDKETGRTVIKVIDRETDEVIRQIPPEYTMQILRRMEIGAGLILEEKA